jgi:hypothetical protein
MPDRNSIDIDANTVTILEGINTTDQRGGLIKKKHETESDVFKKPSLFGLEKLAKQKRDERNLRKNQSSGSETPGISDSTRAEISRF